MAKNDVPRHVLITRFSAMGDVAMTIPVVYRLCEAYPDVNFVFATRRGFDKMMLNRPANLTVEGINLKEYHGAPALWRLARDLAKRYDIDALADLHSVMRTWVMGTALRCRGVKVRRIDKGRAEKRARIAHRRTDQLTTSHDRYRDVFRRLGFTLPPDDFTSIFARTDAASPLLPTKRKGEKWLAIAPFAQHEGKAYPIDLMRQVIDEVAAWEGTRLFLFGSGEKEHLALRDLANNHPNATSLADVEHTFADELAIMAHCDAMLSMDSANMHLASLVGLRTVSVWGATHPHCGFLGWRQSLDDVLQADMPCRPCSVFGNKPCHFNDYRCLRAITPEMIVTKLREVLNEPR